MKIIVVDDNTLFLDDLKFFLENRLKHSVIAVASSGEDFLLLDCISKADIILMDISMGELDGFRTTKKITWQYTHLKVIAITMFTEKVYLIRLIESGFKGCVFKSDIFNSLEVAINEVIMGHIFFPDYIKFDEVMSEQE
jgi:DNA-binding NarL/FixJ family response regulator